ncbi:MAG: cupin domain-containing protein [Alphaproteobacteria bacterium]|nr:cupin domain-containing protein [Alphaproteobacteria bacterium]
MLIDWDILPGAPGMRAGAERKAIAAERLSAVRVVTAPDAQFDGRTHHHEHEQLFILLKGEARLTVGGETITAKPGDMVFFPSGVSHGLAGVGPEGAEYYEIFAPARTDQLPGWIGPSIINYD